jgi:alpha-methylacyl-CoA racemase
MGSWSPERQDNLIDGAAPFYGIYECADGKYVAVGALETQFFSAFLEGLGVDPAEVGPQMDKTGWADMRHLFAERFLSRTRDDWAGHFAATDACVSPVLTWDEAADDPHLASRGTWVKSAEGHLQAAPAPRFSRTPGAIPPPPASHGTPAGVMKDWAFSSERTR